MVPALGVGFLLSKMRTAWRRRKYGEQQSLAASRSSADPSIWGIFVTESLVCARYAAAYVLEPLKRL